MQFFSVVDRVLRDFNCHVSLRQDGLATQTGIGLQPPCSVKQIVFSFISWIQAGQAFSHDDVARRAGRAHVTGMLNIDFIFKQRFANRCAS